MNKQNQKRTYRFLLGTFAIGLGLLLEHSYIGIALSLILAGLAFSDEKLGILYLAAFIPIRPFLAVCNDGYKFLGLFIVAALLLKVALLYKHDYKKLLRFHYFELAYFLFCLFGAAVAYWHGVAPIAIVTQLYTFLLFYFLFYIVSRLSLQKEDIVWLAFATFFTSVIMSIHGLIEKLSLRTMLLPDEWKALDLAPTNRIRIYGLAGGPNELALYLIIAFFLSLYLLRLAKGKQKFLLYAGLCIIQTAFWLTYSRGALLTILAFLPLYIAIHKKIPYWRLLVSLTLLSLILSFAVAQLTNYLEGPNLAAKRFTDAFSKETITMSEEDGRIYYVKKGLEVFRDKPITGYGFGTFGDAATQTYSSPIYDKYDITWNFYSDNQYIQVLAETGIIGTMLCMIFAAGIVHIIWKLRQGYVTSPFLLYVLAGSLIGSLVYNILENDTFMMYAFLALGYSYPYYKGSVKLDC
ncbi:MAG: O-antigen ligase family protein [Ectobacillus sp.]